MIKRSILCQVIIFKIYTFIIAKSSFLTVNNILILHYFAQIILV